MKICWKFTHPQAIQHVYEFVSSPGQIIITITCSLMDPLQWMGAVRMRVQTADKNSTSNPHNCSPLLTSCEVRSGMFVKKKNAPLRYLSLNHRLAKYSIHKIASSSGIFSKFSSNSIKTIILKLYRLESLAYVDHVFWSGPGERSFWLYYSKVPCWFSRGTSAKGQSESGEHCVHKKGCCHSDWAHFGVPKVSRPRRRWVETPDRWGGPHRDQTSSDEEIELPEKERHKHVQEDTDKTRRGGKYDNSSHRCILHVLSIASCLFVGTQKFIWLYLRKHNKNNILLRDFRLDSL